MCPVRNVTYLSGRSAAIGRPRKLRKVTAQVTVEQAPALGLASSDWDLAQVATNAGWAMISNMAEIDRFDAYMRLAEFSALKHDRRRQFEWKVSLGYWGVLVVGIAYLHVLTVPKWILIALVWLSAILFAFGWLRGIWVASTTDRMWSDYYMHEAEGVIDCEAKRQQKPQPIVCLKSAFGFLSHWGTIFQFGTTVFLALAFTAVVVCGRDTLNS